MAGLSCNVDASFLHDTTERVWRLVAEPYCTIERPVENPVGSLVLRDGDDTMRSVALAAGASWTEVMLHGEMNGRRADTGSGAVFESFVNGAVYAVTNDATPTVEILYPEAGEQSLIDAFRVVRGWLTMEHEHRGAARCHLAAVTVGGRGVALVGRKGAGKTSFGLTLLRHPDVAYVTNDKALVQSDDNGRPTVLGLPYAIAIGQASLQSLPEISLHDGFMVKDKLYVWPLRLAELLGTSAEREAPLQAVFACELDLEATEVGAEPLATDEVEALLIDAVSDFGGGDRINPDWLGNELGLSRNHEAPRSLVNVPWFRVFGNPWLAGWRDCFEESLVSGPPG